MKRLSTHRPFFTFAGIAFCLLASAMYLVYTADSVWEAPNWSPDGTYLLSNSGGHIYRFPLTKSGTAEPKELAIPSKV